MSERKKNISSHRGIPDFFKSPNISIYLKKIYISQAVITILLHSHVLALEKWHVCEIKKHL